MFPVDKLVELGPEWLSSSLETKFRNNSYLGVVENNWRFELTKSNVIVHDWAISFESRMDTANSCTDSL